MKKKTHMLKTEGDLRTDGSEGPLCNYHMRVWCSEEWKEVTCKRCLKQRKAADRE